MSKIIKVTAVALSLAMLSGCTGGMKQQVEAAQAAAAEAMAKANAAHSLATKS